MKALITAALVVFALAAAAGAAFAAGQQKVTVRVDGLACPFCAYGLEKKLRRIEGVEDWEIQINDGRVILLFSEDARVDEEVLARKVKEAGFTPREIRVEKVASAAQGGKEAETEQSVNERTISLEVSGMACSACSKRVTEALSKIDCVEKVQVHLDSGVAQITCNDAAADPRRFVEVVEGLGFKAQLRGVRP